MVNSDKLLNINEKSVLYGLVKFPTKNDKQISSILKMKESTFTSIKNRLFQHKMFKNYYIPMLNRLGCEILAIIFSNFNPIIPLKERVSITSEKIEVTEEIFLSIGELEKGFSLSINQDYTTFSQTNEIRTKIFGNLGLFEEYFPHEIIFPFQISTIRNFFNCSHALEDLFMKDKIHKKILEIKEQFHFHHKWFRDPTELALNKKERRVLVALIKNPDATMEQIGLDESVNVSRHTVAKMKKKFIDEGIIKKIVVPDLKKIGFKLLVFYYLNFSPKNPPNEEDLKIIDSPSTLFYINRKFSAVLISVYPDYAEYKEDKMMKYSYLKDHNILTYNPKPQKYIFDQAEFIKYLEFAPITEKILINVI